jgi:hypothetical protein
MRWLNVFGSAFGLVAALFAGLGLRIAAPSEPDSRFSAAQQVAMQQWNFASAWPEFLITVVAAAVAAGCFAIWLYSRTPLG